MQCDMIKDLLPDFVKDTLDQETKAHVKKHIEECRDCTHELHFYETYYNSLKQVKSVDAPDDFLQSLQSKLEKKPSLIDDIHHMFSSLRLDYVLKFSGVAVTAVVILIFMVPFFNQVVLMQKSSAGNDTVVMSESKKTKVAFEDEASVVEEKIAELEKEKDSASEPVRLHESTDTDDRGEATEEHMLDKIEAVTDTVVVTRSESIEAEEDIVESIEEKGLIEERVFEDADEIAVVDDMFVMDDLADKEGMYEDKNKSVLAGNHDGTVEKKDKYDSVSLKKSRMKEAEYLESSVQIALTINIVMDQGYSDGDDEANMVPMESSDYKMEEQGLLFAASEEDIFSKIESVLNDHSIDIISKNNDYQSRNNFMVRIAKDKYDVVVNELLKLGTIRNLAEVDIESDSIDDVELEFEAF